jgi:aminodeoxyfutalosine synthase
MAGATSPQAQTQAEMVKAIREAGRTPVQRNTFYEVLAHGHHGEAQEGDSATGKSAMLEGNLATG